MVQSDPICTMSPSVVDTDGVSSSDWHLMNYLLCNWSYFIICSIQWDIVDDVSAHFSLRSCTKFFCFLDDSIVLRQLHRSWFDNNRLSTWQFRLLQEVLAINKLQIWLSYILCMVGVITILNQPINVDCLLIAVLMTQRVILACKASCLLATDANYSFL